MKALFMGLRIDTLLNRVYSRQALDRIAGNAELLAPLADPAGLEERRGELGEVSFIFSTWGMPALDEEQIAAFFPELKALFYAAGSVQNFALPFLSRGVRVFSAAEANAVPVIEYTAAQILLANKGFFGASRLYSAGRHAEAKEHSRAFPGNFDTPVGIIGAGKIGRGLIARLKDYRLKIELFDPFMDAAAAASLGARKRESLEELFSSCFTISNHLADKPETRGMLRYEHFSLMDDHGVFINTGRGRQLVEADLARAFSEKPGRTALLDVSYPEPVEKGHPFLSMDNIILSPHIAGSGGRELIRMGDYMAEEFERFLDGAPLRYEVDIPMLATLA
ncbi:MAG: hydroxyacid dehydrogenase [Treponema sp.]|jgi:phosphoglycerate dehydrogenase-like enzyme|nr:hydroxyacid dehydrogenase [Treponema sp.]